MKNILSKQSKRYLSILEFLYFNNATSLKHLAQITNANIKTIREDITEINQFITPLIIKESEQYQYCLTCKDNISCDFIYSRILYSSLEFNLLEKIFFESENRLEEYADSLFISVSTLKRVISRLNKKKMGFEITTNPIQLKGNEEIICRTMAHFFKEKYINKQDFWTELEISVIDKLIEKIVKENKLKLNLTDHNKLRLIIFTSLVRLQNRHGLKTSKKNSQFYSNILHDNNFKMMFKNVFRIDLTSEILFNLIYPMSLSDYVFDIEEIKIYSLSQEKRVHLNKINKLIDELSNTLNISLELKNRNPLILDLFNLEFWTVSKTYLIYDHKHNFLINLSKSYPIVYKFIHKKVTSNEYFKNYKNYEIDEIMYILLTHWDGLIYGIQKYYPKFKVGIYMLSDSEHTKFITSIFNKTINIRFSFEAIEKSSEAESIKQFENYDLIITNVSNFSHSTSKIISVDSYPSPKDFEKIYRAYYEISGFTYFS